MSKFFNNPFQRKQKTGDKNFDDAIKATIQEAARETDPQKRKQIQANIKEMQEERQAEIKAAQKEKNYSSPAKRAVLGIGGSIAFGAIAGGPVGAAIATIGSVSKVAEIGANAIRAAQTRNDLNRARLANQIKQAQDGMNEINKSEIAAKLGDLLQTNPDNFAKNSPAMQRATKFTKLALNTVGKVGMALEGMMDASTAVLTKLPFVPKRLQTHYLSSRKKDAANRAAIKEQINGMRESTNETLGDNLKDVKTHDLKEFERQIRIKSEVATKLSKDQNIKNLDPSALKELFSAEVNQELAKDREINSKNAYQKGETVLGNIKNALTKSPSTDPTLFKEQAATITKEHQARDVSRGAQTYRDVTNRIEQTKAYQQAMDRVAQIREQATKAINNIPRPHFPSKKPQKGKGGIDGL